jgi:hypothetical protein
MTYQYSGATIVEEMRATKTHTIQADGTISSAAASTPKSARKFFYSSPDGQYGSCQLDNLDSAPQWVKAAILQTL